MKREYYPHWNAVCVAIVLGLIGGLGMAGCATAGTAVDDRLFFGRAIPGGGDVTEAQWNTFLAEVVTPRFPDGYTVWRGAGSWKGDDGKVVSEQSSVLEIVHGPDPKIDTKLDEIARAYRQQFNQDAVMRIRTPADMTFWRR
jgi:hypothetical protein